jgi:hypothetical protein
MNDGKRILLVLRQDLDRWEDLLASLSEGQITAPLSPSSWSIKDAMAHLMAWQQVSVARLEAAQLNTKPVFPSWLAGLDPESEEHREQFNARIHDAYRQQSWSRVHQDWRDGFLRFLRLGEEVSQDDLLNRERYPWLKGYPLIAVLEGSHSHHHEHLESLLASIRQRGNKSTG